MKLEGRHLSRIGIVGISVLAGRVLFAQVSPGPLSAAHHFLDSPLKCANCHTFGAGSPKLRCLQCHTAIRERIAEHRGYHARVVNRAKGDSDCARCHTEHYGENFSIVTWPKSKEEFDHSQTGYPLTGRHAGLRCEQCHNARHISAGERGKLGVRDANRTWLGLSPACGTCHEDRHRGQLGADCRRCHDFSGWQPTHAFQHDATRFPLTGRHRDVRCAQCHRPMPGAAGVFQYAGLSFGTCSVCHQDPHRGAFAARCDSCHSVEGWRTVRMAAGFDHARTAFPLTGKHAGVACLKCHKDSNFKAPVAHAKCMDCHQDAHQGQFANRADRGECGSCHTDTGFRPATFLAANHQATRFPLTGKHQGIACGKCHPPAGAATNYHPAFKACADCHRDPHDGQFARAPYRNRCEQCHTVETFRPSTFTLARHESTRFPLGGAHAAVACLDCHRESEGHTGTRQFRFPDQRCEACHQDPHQGQFPSKLAGGRGSVCENCHGLRSWRTLQPFDHALTAFTLEGAHRVLACTECHRPQKITASTVRLPFRLASARCSECHQDVHGGQFAKDGRSTDCAACHTAARWLATRFDHDKQTNFALTGEHENVPCRLCHTQQQQVAGRSVVLYKSAPRECSACHR